MNIPSNGKQNGKLFQILMKSYLSVSEVKLSLVLQETVVGIKQGEKLRTKINKKQMQGFAQHSPTMLRSYLLVYYFIFCIICQIIWNHLREHEIHK